MKGNKVHKSLSHRGDPIANVQMMGETHTSTPPTNIDMLPTPSFFEVSHIISFHVPPSSSSRHYARNKSKRFVTPLPLMENPDSNLLTYESHTFFQACNPYHLT